VRTFLSRSRAPAPSSSARAPCSMRVRKNSTGGQRSVQLASLRFSRGLSTQLEVSDAQLALAHRANQRSARDVRSLPRIRGVGPRARASHPVPT
jgi:hypothetical protein